MSVWKVKGRAAAACFRSVNELNPWVMNLRSLFRRLCVTLGHSYHQLLVTGKHPACEEPPKPPPCLRPLGRLDSGSGV